MPDGILISINTKDVDRLLQDIPAKHLGLATVRALNKVAANVKTAANRAIRTRRALSASAVNKAMDIRKANLGRLTSSLVVTGRPIPLKDYKARQTAKGVTVKVSQGPRKLVSGAFIVGRLGGHVYRRTGKARLPIEKLFGPSLPSTFVQDEVKMAWIAVAKDAMVKRSAEELNFELQRLIKRRAA